MNETKLPLLPDVQAVEHVIGYRLPAHALSVLADVWEINAAEAENDHRFAEADTFRTCGGDVRKLVQQAAVAPKPLTDAELQDVLEAEFLGESGGRDLVADVRVARAAISAFCRSNGIKD